jgi:hypothetical protein
MNDARLFQVPNTIQAVADGRLWVYKNRAQSLGRVVMPLHSA